MFTSDVKPDELNLSTGLSGTLKTRLLHSVTDTQLEPERMLLRYCTNGKRQHRIQMKREGDCD
jgi:hypothetical protein